MTVNRLHDFRFASGGLKQLQTQAARLAHFKVTPRGRIIHLACPRMIPPLQLLTSSPLVIPKRSAMLQQWIIRPLGVTSQWLRRAACVWSCFRPPEANLRLYKWFAVVMRHVWSDYMVTLHIGGWLQLLLDLCWRVWKWSSNYGQVEQINRFANYFWAENGCWGSYID